MPTALITGITGQDGSYLAELLLAKGYRVVGVVRRSSTTPYERIAHLVDRLELVSADLLDQTSLTDAVHDTQPDEIYNLAAQSFVQTSWSQPVLTGEFTALGVTRILGAAIEQNHDARGIVWPDAIAPFRVVVCPVGWGKSEAVRAEATKVYEHLAAAGVDAILDDRDERPGVMFADWELIGVPHRIVIGERGLKDGMAEYLGRRDSEATKVAIGEIASFIDTKLLQSA